MLRLRCRIKIKHKGEIPMSIVNDTSFSFNKQFKYNYDKRINLKLQFPLLHIIPAGEDFYF